MRSLEESRGKGLDKKSGQEPLKARFNNRDKSRTPISNFLKNCTVSLFNVKAWQHWNFK